MKDNNDRPLDKKTKAERVVKYNKKDNVPKQTEVEEAVVNMQKQNI